MRPVILSLALFVSGVAAQQQNRNAPIAPSVQDGSNRAALDAAQTCVDAERELKQDIENLNAKLFYMETHPETGYYVRWQDRQAIMSLVLNELTPYFDRITHARFNGESKICLDNLQHGVKLAHSIYQANLQHRWRGN
jgi:hypothetical protein